MRVGCYTLDLYCTNEYATLGHTECRESHRGSGVGQFTGRTESECLRKAKKVGWKLTPDKELCPTCNANRQQIQNAGQLERTKAVNNG